MAKSGIEKQITQMFGEFSVAAQLCLKGYLATLTWKNYPKVDVFCLNPRNGRQVEIQIKTTRARQMWLPENIADNDPVFVLVHLGEETVEYYVLPPRKVREISDKGLKEWLRGHPKAKKEQPRMISFRQIGGYRDRWDYLRLG
jgi:hypothetical protein